MSKRKLFEDMAPRVVSLHFTDDGSIQLDWVDDNADAEYGYNLYSTVMHANSFKDWEHVGYYAAEVSQDVNLLLEYWLDYARGVR